MIEHQETIKSLLQDLNAASKIIDGTTEKLGALGDYIDRSRFVREVAETLTHIFELESELLDLEPSLVSDFLKPSLDAVDLTPALERLLSENWAIRESTIREFKTYMLNEIASQFVFACESGTGH
ncbi:hypothetical protein IQ250_26045, partial [Pseudanabaenaceae cyanobacterium LEGE 13415]|nr:hypothetical protein [Pseudanabaenaceae cyanobacterium LEGE 13415]